MWILKHQPCMLNSYSINLFALISITTCLLKELCNQIMINNDILRTVVVWIYIVSELHSFSIIHATWKNVWCRFVMWGGFQNTIFMCSKPEKRITQTHTSNTLGTHVRNTHHQTCCVTPHRRSLGGTGFPLLSVTLKARGCNFVRKRPTTTFQVSKFPQNVWN